MLDKKISRRNLLAKSGAIVVGFSLAPAVASFLSSATPALAGPTTNASNQVDAWLAIDTNSNVTVYCGKVELGTGVQTALSQIVVEELYLNFPQVVGFVQGDTSLTPNSGYTAGSQTVQGEGVNLRRAAATAFQQLLTLASQQLGVSTSKLVAQGGSIGIGQQMKNALSYGQLIGGQQFNLTVNTGVTVKSPSTYTVVGQPVPRVDLPGKVFGTFEYVQDVVVPNMLHGRVVRPSGRNATLAGTPSLPSGLAGSPQIVTKGNFVGVVATDEWAAIQAASQLNVTWNQGAPLAASDDGTATTRSALIQALQNPANIFNTSTLSHPGNAAAGLAGAAQTLQATYFTPYQMHAAIGPSCAVADVRGGQATIWSGTQGVYPLQGAIAQLLGLSASAVHVIYVEASGCYGHNGADDAAADAALLSQAVGAPVRVQWMRPDEHGWEPLGSAMVHAMQGGLDSHGNAVAWEHALWTQTHSTRPGGRAGNLLAGQELGFAPQTENPTGLLGGRNSIVNYAFPNSLVTANSVRSFTTTTSGSTIQTTNVFPRTTALRTLGGFSNTFANESFMDEMAMAANADPLAFRQQYLSDPRGLAVLKAVTQEANWQKIPWPTTPVQGQTNPLFGRGLAYVQYENTLAYVATYAEVLVDPTTGAVQVTRVIVVHDCGLIINPDGLTNQIQGNVIQATSRTLKEEVLFDADGITSTTWAGVPTSNTWSIKYQNGPSYSILHFNEVPRVQVLLLDQPTQPALGAGEPTSESVAAAIGNAIYFAIGVRLRELPFTPTNVLSAWQAALASS